MPDLAASAARAVCPHCDRPVRSGIELAAELADLVDALAAVRHLSAVGATPEALSLARFGAGAVAAKLAVLRAEVAGAHLACAVASALH